MSGSSFGEQFCVTTWGESHGKAVGVVIDGCPAGLSLEESAIQAYLDRRKPGQSAYTSSRKESDQVKILSGVYEGKTTGTPISLLVRNEDPHSEDYDEIAGTYRPGHADYTYDCKYGFRDTRGGGRSSGRETVGRVAAGAVASLILEQLGITVTAFTKAIGPVSVSPGEYHFDEIDENDFKMPNKQKATEAAAYLDQVREGKNSSGSVVECIVKGLPAGIGEPVFDKLNARLSQAISSIGAVKGIEFGDGFQAATTLGSEFNDAFEVGEDSQIQKETNHAGGILGGISDGDDLVFRAAFKPTPSIASPQQTVTTDGKETTLSIKGRHDPVIGPRAAVVVEAMTAITLVDLLFQNMHSRMDDVIDFYHRS